MASSSSPCLKAGRSRTSFPHASANGMDGAVDDGISFCSTGEVMSSIRCELLRLQADDVGEHTEPQEQMVQDWHAELIGLIASCCARGSSLDYYVGGSGMDKVTK